MLLQRLREYSRRLELSPAMYQKSRIRWLIDLDGDGNLLGFVPTAEGREGQKDRGKEYMAPHVLRSSTVVRPKLLADTAEYVLGLARDPRKQEHVDECHRQFVDSVRDCAATTGEKTVRAVLRFLDRLDRTRLRLPREFNPADLLTFRIDGVLPIDLKAVQAFWADKAGGREEGRGQPAGERINCLICGRRCTPVKRLQFKIKRIPGGQPSGMALISANVRAFESYGLEASLIAPTCQDCGERFSKAANALIEGEDTHLTVGPLVYVFWTRAELGFSVASILSRPEPEQVRTLIASAFTGKEAAAKIDPAPFYATAFSASGGRVVVRDWLDTTVPEVRRHLGRYFALQRIVERDGSEGTPFGLYTLAASTVRDVARELPPNLPKVLLHMALKGGPLPFWLLFQAVRRNRAGQRITRARARAALIKMVLLSQERDFMEDLMVQLDPLNCDPAYLCGRLLAVLEAVQRAAVPGANTTITDRFFGTASSAPASVFGRLLRGSQPHLAKLRKERRGTYEALQRRLEEVQGALQSFPKTLTLEEQGLFGLGYYHQRAADRAAAISYKQSSQAGRAAALGDTAE